MFPQRGVELISPVQRVSLKHNGVALMTIIAYKYALREPLNWGEDCTKQLRLANEFWNELVQIEENHKTATRAIINQPSELTDLNERIAVLRAEVDAWYEEKKERNRKARKKTDTSDLDTQIKAHKAELKPLYEQAKEARTQSIVDSKPLLDAQTEIRFAVIKQARQDAAAKGLWWCNYNATVESFKAAVSRTYKEGGQLRSKHFNGEGRLTNQIQKGMTVEELFSGDKSQVQMVSEPWRYKGAGENFKFSMKKSYHIEICAFTQDRVARTVKFPIVYHRPLPQNAIIKMVTVKRQKRFDRWQWFVVFTLDTREDIVLPSYCTDTAVVNFGWRKTEDGIRIATVLRGGCINHVIYPDRIYNKQLNGEVKRGEMDDLTNQQIAWLKQLQLEWMPENLRDVVSTILSYKKITGGHFEWIRRVWATEASLRTDRQVTFKELEEYCAEWRLYSRNAAAWRQHIDDARLYFYRDEVRRLFQGCGRIVVNGHDMSATAMREHSTLPKEVQHQRVLTAPSVFRGTLLEYAKKIGMKVVEDKLKHDTCACHGLPFIGHDRQKLYWPCPVDGRDLDQDDNFCYIMYQRQCIDKIAA